MRSADPTLQWMIDHGLPLTRETYLYVLFLGKVPQDTSEVQFPEEILRAEATAKGMIWIGSGTIFRVPQTEEEKRNWAEVIQPLLFETELISMPVSRWIN